MHSPLFVLRLIAIYIGARERGAPKRGESGVSVSRRRVKDHEVPTDYASIYIDKHIALPSFHVNSECRRS